MQLNVYERIRTIDKLFCLLVLILVLIGVATIYSAAGGNSGRGDYFASRQVVWTLLSIVLFVVLISSDYRKFFEWSYRFYIMILVVFVILLFIGSAAKGAQSWISFGPFHVQPAEFGKVAFALALSRYLVRNRPNSFGNLFRILALATPAILLVLLQPDLGSAAVYVFMLLVGIAVSGGLTVYIGSLLALGFSLMPLFWFMLKDYQKMRLAVFLNPSIDPLGAGYNVIQSRIAVGSGGLLGRGYLEGMQSKLHFLPEPHTDFIFSVYAEEFGFLGSVFLLILFLLLARSLIGTAVRTKDIRAKFFISMITGWITFQMVESVAMSMGLMPVTGLPLPFVSYGGSSLLSIFIALGIIANVQLSGLKVYR